AVGSSLITQWKLFSPPQRKKNVVNRHTAIQVTKVPTEEVASKAAPRSWRLLLRQTLVAVLVRATSSPETVAGSMRKALGARQVRIPDPPAMTCRTRSGIPE